MDNQSKFYYFDQHDELFVGEAEVEIIRESDGVTIDVSFIQVYNTETDEFLRPYSAGFDRKLFAALKTAAYECASDAQMSAHAEKYWLEYTTADDDEKLLKVAGIVLPSSLEKTRHIMIKYRKDVIVRWSDLYNSVSGWRYPEELPQPIYDYITWLLKGGQESQGQNTPNAELAAAA